MPAPAPLLAPFLAVSDGADERAETGARGYLAGVSPRAALRLYGPTIGLDRNHAVTDVQSGEVKRLILLLSS